MYPSHLIGKILQQLLLSNNFLYWQLLSSITFSRPVTPFSMYLRDFSCVCTIYVHTYVYLFFSKKRRNHSIFGAFLVEIILHHVPTSPTSTYVHENLPRRSWKYTIFFVTNTSHHNPTNTPCLTLEHTYVYSKWTLQ